MVVSVTLLLCFKTSGKIYIVSKYTIGLIFICIMNNLVCRSLVQNLEKVDPSRMKREEKLAFWINIHNALVMHVSNKQALSL